MWVDLEGAVGGLGRQLGAAGFRGFDRAVGRGDGSTRLGVKFPGLLGGRFVTAMLCPAKRPSGVEIKPFLLRLVRAIRARWPRIEILLRADSHYCCPEVLDWCRANGIDFILGVARLWCTDRGRGVF